MSAWLLPDHIADVLPSEARHIEELRRLLLDTARSYGYELVIPPMIEHLDSLLTGTGEALGLQTFKLVDQLSGRSLGLRADTTPQVARIDAHLLGRKGITRLAYCGPVLHARPERAHGTREPLQLGAELYGHAGREADLEILSLALDCLRAASIDHLSVDMADARIVRGLLAEVPLEAEALHDVHAALAAKDESELSQLTRNFPVSARNGLLALVQLYGDEKVLVEAEKRLASSETVRAALADMKWLAARLDGAKTTFDLADLRGYSYYSGTRFAVYAQSAGDALLRGGRYDGVGAVFGHKLDRDRPAVGFSMDVKQLVRAAPTLPLKTAIRAPWSDAPGLRAAVASLRGRGETVVCALPGDENEIDEFRCDRELHEVAGQWVVQVTDESAH
ncbi:ATP phosphoribosyltransferase regulatory subunit [Ottowia thiooxydans]|uniref:ATP phosphoribosyltransferase regulatory subunit n=1 Tax=Ottowia thiooxydans TaxID=219182 RepID=UPI00041AEF64|nr:ATP phosphoribosyltransferase regulatory subunit [Ottowia thiooxydans]